MKWKTILLFVFVLLSLVVPAFADEDEDDGPEDAEIFGLELEKLLNLGSGILATILFVVVALAYKRTQRSKLLFVACAFFFFAIKGYLGGAELFFDEWPYVDPIKSILDFVVMIAFFLGVMKK